jgi:hypothetical protein
MNFQRQFFSTHLVNPKILRHTAKGLVKQAGRHIRLQRFNAKALSARYSMPCRFSEKAPPDAPPLIGFQHLNSMHLSIGKLREISAHRTHMHKTYRHISVIGTK